MDVYGEIAHKIIAQQESIIGPIAVEQAKRVKNLTVNWPKEIKVTGDAPTVIDQLVKQYEHLFGQLSVEVCRDATTSLVAKLAPEQQPKTLKA